MQYTESRFRNSTISREGTTPSVLLADAPSTLKPPRSRWGVISRVSRMRLAFALSSPAICGIALAWWQYDILHALTLIFTLLAVFTSAWSFNLLTEYYDYRRSSILNDPQPHISPATGYQLLVNGRIAPGLVRSFGYFLLSVSLLCAAWLALLVGWPMLFFYGLSLLLTSMYMLPPVRYAYRGWGIGELGVFLSYGVLQTLAAFYAQTHTLSPSVLWACLPLGLLVALCSYNYNFLHHHRDWLLQKRTLVVQLGPMRAVDISIMLTVAAYISLLLIAAFAMLPLRTLVTLATLPTAISAFSAIDRETMSTDDGFAVVRSSTNATLWTTLFFCIVLALFD